MNRLAPLTLVALVATGCAIGPDAPPQLAPPPRAFAESAPGIDPSEPSPDFAFWRQLDDPILARLVERGLRESPDMARATSRIREARAIAGVARSALLPSIDGSAGYSRNGVSTEAPELERLGASRVHPFDDWQSALTMAYEVDIWGKNRRAHEASRDELFAEVEHRRAAGLALAGEICASYLQARTLARRREVALATLAGRETTLGLVRAREAAGLATDVEVALAESELASAEVVVPDLDRLAALEEHRLAILVGAAPGSLRAELSAARDAPLHAFHVPVGIPAGLVARRPDVREASLRLAAATARIGQAEADLLPQVVIEGEIGLDSLDAWKLASKAAAFWAVGPSLKVPLFDFGRRLDQWTAAEERADGALHDLERAVLVALGEAEDALATLREESRRQEKLLAAVRSSERSTTLSRDRFGAGLASYVEVVDADRALDSSRDALLESDRRLALGAVQLSKAVAGSVLAVERSLPPIERAAE
jgi:NodT family efflux transporter outer membrane factor (OMF) lipoprotein